MSYVHVHDHAEEAATPRTRRGAMHLISCPKVRKKSTLYEHVL